MPNRQKFIGNAEALIELLNDMHDDLAEIVRRCNAAHSPDTTIIISRARDIANN